MENDRFLAWFQQAEKHSRLSSYTVYDDYYCGRFGNIKLPKHIKDSLSVDVAIFANICKPIVDVKAQYLLGGSMGITVESNVPESSFVSEEQQAELPSNQAERFLYDVFETNKLLFENMLKLIRILTLKGDVFIKVYVDTRVLEQTYSGSLKNLNFWKEFEGLAKLIRIKVLSPENVFPKYRDDDYEELDCCAIKYYELSETGEKVWKLQVWYPDHFQEWVANDSNRLGKLERKWVLLNDFPNELGFIPIIHIKNSISDREYGISDLQPVIEIQDAINKTLTDMALTMDYQAFQRLFVIGAMMPPGKVWDVSPGTVTELPNPQAKVEVIPTADINPYLAILQQLKALACEVSQTPQVALGQMGSGIPSGYALRIHYLPLENKCNETRALLQSAMRDLCRKIFVIAVKYGMDDWTAFDVKIQFPSGLPIDRDSIVKIHKEQLAMGTISRETAMQEQGIQDVEQELMKIKAEQFDVEGGALRATVEAEELQKRLKEQLLTTAPEQFEAD